MLICIFSVKITRSSQSSHEICLCAWQSINVVSFWLTRYCLFLKWVLSVAKIAIRCHEPCSYYPHLIIYITILSLNFNDVTAAELMMSISSCLITYIILIVESIREKSVKSFTSGQKHENLLRYSSKCVLSGKIEAKLKTILHVSCDS